MAARMFFLFTIAVTVTNVSSLYIGQAHVCTKYMRRQKTNGQYHKVVEIICCRDFIEVDNHCIVCPAGKYGRLCSQDCLCSHNSQCNHIDGKCICSDGWLGTTCNEPCPDNFFGRSCSQMCSCPNQLPCHNVNGTCQCPKGYEGPDCNIPCPPGKFGGGCRFACLCKHGTCDRFDGNCTCQPGWEGKRCDQVCSHNTYGPGCHLSCKCSQSGCEPVNGTCLCDDGFQGQNCSKGSINTGVVIGIVIGSLAVIIIGVMVFITFKRHHTYKHSKTLTNPTKDDRSSNHYDDIDEYAEIRDVDVLSPKEYNYAYSDDTKPPVKARKPTTRRKANEYMSITDAERESRVSNAYQALKIESGSAENLNPYTGLLGNDKCASYQQIDQETTRRSSSRVNSQWEPGYLKPTAMLEKNKVDKDGEDDEYVQPSSRYSNTLEIKARNDSDSSSLSETGYLKPKASVKKTEATDDMKPDETDSATVTRDDDKTK